MGVYMGTLFRIDPGGRKNKSAESKWVLDISMLMVYNRTKYQKKGLESMKITKVRLGRISVPLRTPFKTALRSVSSVEDVIVELHTDCGAIGYGEAPPTGAITGDTTGAIIGAIQDHIAKTILGREVD